MFLKKISCNYLVYFFLFVSGCLAFTEKTGEEKVTNVVRQISQSQEERDGISAFIKIRK